MISWLWLIPALFVGAILGMMVMALCAAGKERWKDE